MDSSGKKEEEQACQYLRKQGYKIAARNWRSVFGEIDIIAREGDTLVFIEVKSRHGRNPVSPEESLTAEKRKRINATARLYLSQTDNQLPVRFDFIAIRRGTIILYRNAFQSD